jgi:hypothetical protein
VVEPEKSQIDFLARIWISQQNVVWTFRNDAQSNGELAHQEATTAEDTTCCLYEENHQHI